MNLKSIMKALIIFIVMLVAGTAKGMADDQIIFTHEEYDNFNAALPHAIKETKDGEKLWMYVSLRNPIGSYTFSNNFTDKEGNLVENIGFQIASLSQERPGTPAVGSAEQTVFIKGGDKAESGQTVNKSYFVYLKNIDAEKTTEFKICLSEYIRHKSSFTFLKTIGGRGGKAGRLNTIFILKGKNSDEFLQGEIVCNVESGFPQYRKAWTLYEMIVEKGEVADNVLPPTGKFTDAGVRTAITKEAKTTGINAEKVVFTVDGWEESTTNDVYHLKQRKVYAYLSYKEKDQCLYAMAEVEQKLSSSGKWGDSLIKIYNKNTPISCK
ncbi:MAG: hypothetical protein IAF08_16770 [Rhizobacter sp.]|nr:hypothetical protein [Chlorobiales bacterium]